MTENSHSAGAGPAHRSVEIGVAVAMLLFAAVIIYGSVLAGINWGAEGPRAGFFPFYVGLSIFAASAINLYRAVTDGSPGVFAEWGQLRQVVAVVIPTAIYVALVPWLGLYVSSFILVAYFMRWLGHYGWALAAAVSVGVTIAAYLMFERWFLVPLPKGPIEDLLGL